MDNMNVSHKEGSAGRAEKNHLLYLRQKALLDTFLEKGAISKAQYDKSLGDMKAKMGEE